MSKLSRRGFFKALGGITGSAFLLSGLSDVANFGARDALAQTGLPICEDSIAADLARAEAAYQIREEAAHINLVSEDTPHFCNGDERLYQNGEGSFGKALPHNELGEPRPLAYYALLNALQTGRPEDFAAIPVEGELKLANPQAAFAFELEGPDSHRLSMKAAPAFTDPETAGEMVECYWHAHLRDVHFDDYEGHLLVSAAAEDLSVLSVFNGPKEGEHFNDQRVTPRTLFRGNTPGDLVGPYISQFLLQPVPHGAFPMAQLMRTTLPNDDFMTDYDEWLDVQQGIVTRENAYDETLRHIRNGRDLGEYVHQDFPYQAYLNATLILNGMEMPYDKANPYAESPNQEGFITFGISHLCYLVGSVANRALKTAWFNKWLVHRRIRPEAMSGRIHHTKTGRKAYLVHNNVLDSHALEESFRRHGSFLLPQAYPEGSPTHPSYPAGHATISGACATMLKAFFDESAEIPGPVRVNADGTNLLAYEGPALTVGGELNKLAANISLGRDFAGVHYRSDGIEGLSLGEEVAIHVLRELMLTYNEQFEGFSFTRFNGERITI